MPLRALLLLGCAALSSTFVVQRGPLRLAGSSARVRSGLMVGTESDVKITVKPPKAAGEEGKPLVFLFTDTQIVKESFLEDINNILNTGEVPPLA